MADRFAIEAKKVASFLFQIKVSLEMSEFRNAVPVFFWRQIFSPPSGNCFEAFFRFLIFNILCPTLRKSRDDEDDVIGIFTCIRVFFTPAAIFEL